MRRIFEQETDFVWRVLRRLGVHSDDVEDLAHEVFLTVWRRLEAYDPDRPIRPWLFGIAFRITRRFRDRAQSRHEVLTDHPTPIRPSSSDQEEKLHASRMLQMALRPLDLDRRVVFVMHDMEGWTMPEVVQELQIPLNTGYSRLRLARSQIKQAVARLRAVGEEL
jgi:RNA polymerase sigma-70 factor (ECF subfamily)